MSFSGSYALSVGIEATTTKNKIPALTELSFFSVHASMRVCVALFEKRGQEGPDVENHHQAVNSSVKKM